MSVSTRDLKVDWHVFKLGMLEKMLGLSAPPFTDANRAFRQLGYVEKYAGELRCQSLAIESHYIDRDYIEDHSVFYSKSLSPYSNSCRRVHFFSINEIEVKNRFAQIIEASVKYGLDHYRSACKKFSDESYLGFAVIKPLDGSPVGRTVLRCFSQTPIETGPAFQYRRNFNCTRVYKRHFVGIELSVRGLAFQQQDVGVSACATTAIWTALQKTGDHEEISPATPAQITTLATKYSLPGGRPMPSEGLNVDQMCQAVQAAGVAANLFRVEDVNVAQAYLYSAIKSGFAPVLMIENPIGRHAVAVVGMKVKPNHIVSSIVESTDDAANDLLGLYVHDDRLGPYLRADLARKEVMRGNRWTQKLEPKKLLHLIIPERSLHGLPDKKVAWELTHILIPMHAKIRLSFGGLRYIASEAVKVALRYPATFRITNKDIPDSTITLDTWIVRAHKYVENLLESMKDATADRIAKICTTISLARYVGIIRLNAPYFDPIDILIDTTSTLRNIHCLGLIVPDTKLPHTQYVARYLQAVFKCPLVF